MRIAIFSDVHGNLTALDAVLKDIKKQQPDLIFFAGDLCTGGARPAECIGRIREENIAVVHGNTDLKLTNQPLLDDDIIAAELRREAQAEGNVGWTWSQLNAMDRAWLGTLPFHRRVSPSTHPDNDILIVHANPKNVDQHILPAEEKQKDIYGELKQPDDDLELIQLLDDLSGGIVAFGHLHIPNIRSWNGIKLVNISSVSLPLDGDNRAKYGLFTWENNHWSINHHYVEYDVEKEVEILQTIQPPGWQEIQSRLRKGSE